MNRKSHWLESFALASCKSTDLPKLCSAYSPSSCSTCSIAAIRMKYFHLYADPTWENVPAALWSLGEICCGIICCSLLNLRHLVARPTPALSTRHSRSSTGTACDEKQNSHYRRSDVVVDDPEQGPRASCPRSFTGSEHDLIYGPPDYRLRMSGSEAAKKSDLIKRESTSEQGDGVEPQIQPPQKIQLRYDWAHPAVDTQVEACTSPSETSSNHRYSRPVIRVKHDIFVHDSSAPAPAP